jgi:glycosyltransferase involved in cell wall biosynthesis
MDLHPSVHHARIKKSLSRFFEVESFFLIKNEFPKISTNYELMLFGELDKSVEFISQYKYPKIGISWSYDIQRMLDNPIAKLSEKLLNFDVICVDCELHKSNLIDFGVTSENIFKLPYGVNIGEYSFKKSRTDSSNIRLYSNRSWNYGYGHDILFSAFKKISEEFSNVEFLLAGHGPLLDEYKIRYAKLANHDKFIFLNNVSQKDNRFFLSESDLFVSASQYDGISVSILESMAVGTPVLVSDIEPNKEIIESGFNGFLFKKDSIEDLVEVFRSYITQMNNFSHISSNARNTVERIADLDSNIDNFVHFMTSRFGIRI